MDLNHFCSQNPSSDKVKETVKKDNDDENEIAFAKHDLHLDKKRTQAKKLGQVKYFLDGLCTTVNVLILSLIIENKKSKESIFSQLMSRFAKFSSLAFLQLGQPSTPLRNPN